MKKVNSLKKRTIITYIISALLIIALIMVGTFIYNQKSKEAFGKTYNTMNSDYKTVLFASGQDSPKTLELMNKYKASFNTFYTKYDNKPIKPYNTDTEWKNSLNTIQGIITTADTLIKENKSKNAHLELEKVRQIWQETFKRNNITMLGFYLTEFHDIMEKAIEESEKKDFEKLNLICIDMQNSWTEVVNTQTEFNNDFDYTAKITTETTTINNFCNAVKNRQNTVKELSSELKSGFIPFYLKYG